MENSSPDRSATEFNNRSDARAAARCAIALLYYINLHSQLYCTHYFNTPVRLGCAIDAVAEIRCSRLIFSRKFVHLWKFFIIIVKFLNCNIWGHFRLLEGFKARKISLHAPIAEIINWSLKMTSYAPREQQAIARPCQGGEGARRYHTCMLTAHSMEESTEHTKIKFRRIFWPVGTH